MYTQQATGLLRENANNDPQGVSSLLATSWEEVEEQEYSSWEALALLAVLS
jgi:hypothetical protein